MVYEFQYIKPVIQWVWKRVNTEIKEARAFNIWARSLIENILDTIPMLSIFGQTGIVYEMYSILNKLDFDY